MREDYLTKGEIQLNIVKWESHLKGFKNDLAASEDLLNKKDITYEEKQRLEDLIRDLKFSIENSMSKLKEFRIRKKNVR